MNRREFLQHAITGGIAASLTTSMRATSVHWPIGCFNRPWTSWSFDETLFQRASFTPIALAEPLRRELL